MVIRDFVPLCLITMACLSCPSVVSADSERQCIAPVNGWVQLPVSGGGNITGVEIAPSDPNVWYAHVDVGGPYRSDDGGRTWRPLHQNMTLAMRAASADHVKNISIDPRDPDRIVMVAGDGWNPNGLPAGAYVSSDGGKSFHRTLKARFKGEGSHTKRLGRALSRHPTRPDELVAAADGDGIFLSVDGGDSWTACGGDGYFFSDIRHDLTSEDRIYASAPRHADRSGKTKSGFLRSDDGGRRWTAVAGAEAPDELVQIPGRRELLGVFALAGASEMRISADGGATWSGYSEGLPHASKNIAPTDDVLQAKFLAVAAGRDFYLAANWTGRMFRREPGEPRWTEIPMESLTLGAPEKQTAQLFDLRRKFRRCTCSITVDPHDERHFITTDWHQIWESKDGGRNWRTATDGIHPLVPFMVSCDPFSPQNILYGAADMGLYTSHDGGRTYTHSVAISGANSAAWSRRRKGRVYACGGKFECSVIISDDAGRCWRRSRHEGLPPLTSTKAGGYGVYTVAVDPSTDWVYVCVSGKVGPGKGGIYRSADGDVWHWFGKGLPVADRFYKSAEFEGNGGAGWMDFLVFSADGSAMTVGWHGGNAYYLDRNAGEWKRAAEEVAKCSLAADPFVPGRFLCLKTNRLLEYSDGGRQVSVLAGSAGLGFNIAFDRCTKGLVVANSSDRADICVSRDGGRHWSVLPYGASFLPTGNMCDLSVDRERLFVLTRGSGVWVRDLRVTLPSNQP